MTTPCIITVAINGSVPQKEDNPAVPITVSEMVESTQEAFEAGASIVHMHVRDDHGRPSSDPDRFKAAKDGIEKHCPGMIIQYSTGGRGRSQHERGAMLDQGPDMASLSTGSVNFPTHVYENPPQLIDELAEAMKKYGTKAECELFDLSMLYNAKALVDRGQLDPKPHVQFVMGIKNAQPARREILEFELAQLKALMPEATWTAAGLGRYQLEVNHWALELGGHCRTGLEDNIKFDATRLAKSNAELVARVADLTVEYDRHPATVAEARALLGLRAFSST